jgi:hypothetical protein
MKAYGGVEVAYVFGKNSSESTNIFASSCLLRLLAHWQNRVEYPQRLTGPTCVAWSFCVECCKASNGHELVGGTAIESLEQRRYRKPGTVRIVWR